MTDDDQARQERAQRLRKQIEALKSGRTARRAPSTPREFVEQQTPDHEETTAEPRDQPEGEDD
jgi:uncharacterized membrane-anchored protein